MKLICVFVFAYAKSRFSHDAAQIIILTHHFFNVSCNLHGMGHEVCLNICGLSDQMSHIMSNRAADQHLCFYYIDSKIPLLPNQKFQSSSYLLWPYSPVCNGPGGEKKDRFSCNEAQIVMILHSQSDMHGKKQCIFYFRIICDSIN